VSDAAAIRDRPVLGGPRRARVLHRASAVTLVVTAGVALAIGSVGRSAPPTLAARAASLESKIRCPSCQDISVAQSDASAAVAARRQITRMLSAGASDAAIEQSFVDRYGPSILLVPPTSGLGSLIWVLPVVGVVLALGALGVLFWRRQRDLRRLRAP